MKTIIPRRPSTTLSRVMLACFIATLPGNTLYAQVATGVGAAGSGAGALGAIGTTFGGVAPTPAFSAVLAPASLAPSLAPSAPAAMTPISALAATALAPQAIPAAAATPANAKAVLTGAAASAKNFANPALTGGDVKSAAATPFDGSKDQPLSALFPTGSAPSTPGGNDDGNKPRGGALVPVSYPAEAPVIALNKVFFPGVNAVRFSFTGDETAALVTKVLRTGGWMIATTAGGDAKGHSPAAVLVKLSQPEMSGEKPSVIMTTVRTATISGYKESDGVPVAVVTYPKMRAGNTQRAIELGALAVQTLQALAQLDPKIDEDVVRHAYQEESPERLANMLAQNLPLTDAVKQQLLTETSTEDLLQAVILELNSHLKEKSAKPKPAAPGAPGGNAKGPTTAESMKNLETLKARMKAIGMPDAIQEITTNEYNKLMQMNPKDSEAQKARTYVEWLLDVPWGQRTEDNLDVPAARVVLDEDHYGLEKVKERVLEFLALRKKTGSKKGAIIAFTGPPGVGKTSIASAIAKALGRKFVRLSLGGVHDESVLRGHGRTYVGSMPGEIMRQMKNAGTINPVMLMDEVDKIGRNGNQGDPTAALLEILDPAQNNTYRDRYLDVPYDLSEVLFVVTSNELGNIPEPLRDRMEIIEFDGYTTLEKIAIAERHVVPQKLKVTGLKPEDATLTRGAIMRVIEGYTMEAGVRKLREQIESLLRKISAWTETRGEKVPGTVDETMIEKYLGVEKYSPRQTAQNGVGVATGLAVNTYGGSTLNVEVSKEPGTGQLKLRKQFGDDIEDSAKNAYKYVKLNAAKYGLEKMDFTKIDLDINITPAGKVDGPSAGGLMVTAIISALTGRSVTPGLAMTGEITMRGDVLPIGGLKQKVMAAHRMGYKEVIFPWANRKDIEDIPKEVRDGIKLTPVKTYDEIYPNAIVPETPKA